MHVCTIIAKNYLAHARVLAESFRRHHPDGTLHVLVLDDYEGYFDPDAEPFELVTPEELHIDGFEEMAAVYDVLELSTAVKPWLLRTLLERTQGAGIVYLDPDIEIFGSLEPVEELMHQGGLVLIPHVTAPMPRDGRKPSETDILIAGAFNLGFMGLGNDDAAQALLDWWSERLRTDCRVDPERGFFVDQRWMDFAPGIVSRLEILRDPGYDVAYWNLPSRTLSRNGTAYLVDDSPLRFFHFSGYDPGRRDQLSRHQDRIELRSDPVLSELCDRYGDSLVEQGYPEVKSWPYSYAELPGGIALDRPTRRLLAAALEEGRLIDSVFDPEAAQRFVAWLNEPAPSGGAHGVTRYLLAVYEERRDLRRRFPDLDGGDGVGLVEWARERGQLELSAAPDLLPAGDGTAPRQKAQPTGATAPAHPAAQQWGVNVAGYLNSELGVGEAARLLIRALDAQTIPLAPVGIAAPASRQEHHFSAGVPSFPYPVNVLCANADGLPGFVGQLEPGVTEERYTIGMWFWEVSTFPERWKGSFDYLDEVWVASEHIAQALEPHASIPVTKITVPIEPQSGVVLSRARLGMPSGFTFLFVFDYHSVFTRKNPLGLIDAFTRAFPTPGEASLVLKSINHQRYPEDHRRLLDAAGGRPDIHVIDRYVSMPEKNAMLASCDCYASLHRSEGLGLTMGEAMAFGKPVIATGYSGNLDFMTEEGSWLVRHELVPIGDGHDPYPPEGVWAEPDLDHAARLMRQVVDEPEAARRRALHGQSQLRATHSARSAGAMIAERLAQVRELAPERTGQGNIAAAAARGAQTAGIRRRLRAGPLPPQAARGARGAIRSTVLRSIKRYAQFQQQIDSQILNVLDSLVVKEAREDTSAPALLAAMRQLERTLRLDQTLGHEDLRARVEQTATRVEQMAARFEQMTTRAEQRAARLEQMAEETASRLRRLEPEHTRAERWPVQTPWTHEYVAAHRSFLAATLDDAASAERFTLGARLPDGFGVGLDERVVELPWLFARGMSGEVLDAGSSLNHAHILERAEALFSTLTIATLVSEAPALELDGVTYDDADLRALPYPDGSFDTVACISVLDHVGMDNREYGSDAARASDPQEEALRAVRELRRVLRPGGRLLITVPYGTREDLGWLRQFDRAEVEALADAAGPGERELTVYRYGRRGWQLSDLDAAGDSRYRDYRADPRPVEDLAAAARAVACLEIVAG